MIKQEALKVLEDHQKWRLGDDEVEATNPKELTKAIEVAIISLGDSLEDKYRWRKVSEELPCINQQVLVKYQTYEIAIARYNDGKFYTKVVNTTFGTRAIEWRPID